MTEITITLPDKLAAQIGGANLWLSTIIELSMIGFRSPSTARASAEVINFLSKNPLPQNVLDYFLSDELQARLDYLLDLNGEGEINQTEREELKEWRKFNHIIAMLKINVAKQNK
jgi:hypothetical protein